MKRKVAIVIERADIALGGAERSVFELGMAMASSGFKVDILAAKGQTHAKNIHILCDNVQSKRVGFSAFGKTLRKYLWDNPYDIIHSVLPFDFADVYQPRGGSYAESIIRNAASYQNTTMRLYKQITAIANLRRTTLARAERKLCRKPDGPIVAALSEYVAEQFRNHYNLSEQQLVVIPNGVKTHGQVDSQQADHLRAQILSKLSLKEADKPVFFLFAANNFRLKGLRALIEAMSTAVGSNSAEHAFLIVAGHGRSYKYRHLARTLKVHKRILFLGPIRHIQNALSIIDVAVLPTFYDPSSRFILEALTAQKPVITTKYNGATDLFVNDRHGKVISGPEDTKALAEAIAHFTNHQNIERSSSAIIEDKLEEKISIMRVAEQLSCLYESILKKRRG